MSANEETIQTQSDESERDLHDALAIWEEEGGRAIELEPLSAEVER